MNEQKQCKGTRKPHGVHWEVRGQVAGISFLLSRKSRGPSSGSQVWQQVPLPAEPSGQFLSVSFQVKHTHTLFDTVTPLLGIYPGEKKACPQRQMFTGALYTIVMPGNNPNVYQQQNFEMNSNVLI